MQRIDTSGLSAPEAGMYPSEEDSRRRDRNIPAASKHGKMKWAHIAFEHLHFESEFIECRQLDRPALRRLALQRFEDHESSIASNVDDEIDVAIAQ